jgi:N-acetylmuramoyl-L-alanine amidase
MKVGTARLLPHSWIFSTHGTISLYLPFLPVGFSNSHNSRRIRACFAAPVFADEDMSYLLRFAGITPMVNGIVLAFMGAALVISSGCMHPKPGTISERKGDEIIVAGKMVHTGTRVVTWMDPGGYDAYRVERRFSPLDKSDWKTSAQEEKDLTTPNRYGMRKATLTAEQMEEVRGGGWDLPLLQTVVDQFVIHYDQAGTSRQCFKVLHDRRDLSVHFMLDLDGTIYQTLDAKERAWHATSSNTRSVGIEVANIGAYELTEENPLDDWYRCKNGITTLSVPQKLQPAGIFTPGWIGHPARSEPVTGQIQDKTLRQYDFTPEQYEALTKLTAALCTIFPKIMCDYPRNASGKLLTQKLPDDQLKKYQGILGHYHIQTEKVDPGPAFQWDRVVNGARCILNESARQKKRGAELLSPTGE